MCISKKKCPVPFDQQPLNEYFSLKRSFFFSWSTLVGRKYFQKIFTLFSFLFIILIPFVKKIIPLNTLKLIFLDISIVNLVLVLVFIRLYLVWSYILQRLISATIFYEESGWYDGQIWIKSVEILTKDRLIGLYEVLPFISRIKCSLLIFTVLFIINIIVNYLL
uniref:Ycf36 n=1 Tax=Plocamium cartilagineum TaxID=31452 RepID=A0A1C9CHH8_PLOCA|nr:hypothetical protein Plocam_017 [Plocamium cartilagineum]AOM67853.1 hypothetical protein Plocam_017 [Plocamium cartilagineum]